MVTNYFANFGLAQSRQLPAQQATLAFVVFQKHYPAMLAVQEADGTELNGCTIQVAISENKNLQRRAEKFMMQSSFGGGSGGYGKGWGGRGRGGYGGGWSG